LFPRKQGREATKKLGKKSRAKREGPRGHQTVTLFYLRCQNIEGVQNKEDLEDEKRERGKGEKVEKGNRIEKVLRKKRSASKRINEPCCNRWRTITWDDTKIRPRGGTRGERVLKEGEKKKETSY